jgi:hypothetical protein
LYDFQFSQSAKTIKDAARFYARNGMSSLLALGDTIASEASVREDVLILNETWPFVTTHDFEIKGAHTRLDSATELVLFAPMVTDKNREKWEEYSVDHQDWLIKSAEQALQTNTWFENEFYDKVQAMDHGTMDHGSMNHMNMDDGAMAMDDGAMDTMDHSGMGHGRNMRTGQRFLQVAESMGGMDGMNMTSMVTSMDTGTSDSTGSVDMPGMTSSSTMTMDMGDVTTTMNMTGTASSTSSMGMDGTSMDNMDTFMDSIARNIYRVEADGSTSQESRAFYAPVWQMSPPPKDPSLVNMDLYSNPVFKRMINYIMKSGGQPGLSEFVDVTPLYKGLFTESEHWQLHDQFHGAGDAVGHSARDHPHTLIAAPVRRTIGTDAEIVGILAAVVPWDLYLSRLLPEGIDGVFVVLENTCGQAVTYEINGPEAGYLGKGDMHQRKYNYLKQSYRVSDVLTAPNSKLTADSLQCGKTFVAHDEYDALDRNSASHCSIVLPFQNTQCTCTRQPNSGQCSTRQGPKPSLVSLLPSSLRLEWSSSSTSNTFREDKIKSWQPLSEPTPLFRRSFRPMSAIVSLRMPKSKWSEK